MSIKSEQKAEIDETFCQATSNRKTQDKSNSILNFSIVMLDPVEN